MYVHIPAVWFYILKSIRRFDLEHSWTPSLQQETLTLIVSSAIQKKKKNNNNNNNNISDHNNSTYSDHSNRKLRAMKVIFQKRRRVLYYKRKSGSLNEIFLALNTGNSRLIFFSAVNFMLLLDHICNAYVHAAAFSEGKWRSTRMAIFLLHVCEALC